MSALGEALADRRQRAREAYYDRYALGDNIGGSARKAAVRECIETATRVKLTREIFDAFFAAGPAGDPDNPDWREPLAAAFRAAGFEIEE